MSFQDSVTKYRSVYFHFLDGLLNTTSGGNFSDVLATLNEITPRLLSTNISFGELNHYDNLITTLNINGSNINFSYDSEDIEQINPELFKFCIIPIGFNQHQTTTVVFTKDNKMYLYILNTGLDIQYNGDKIQIDSQDLYQLTKGVMICDDISKPNKLNEAYQYMKNFFLLSYVYNHIYYNKFLPPLAFFSFSDDFKKLIKILITNKLSLFNNIFNLNGSLETLDYINTNLENIFPQGINLIIIEHYYVLASNFINLNTPINIGSIDNINILDYNQNIISQLEGRQKLSENFLKKIILYNQNNNLYIYPQESGSCTWYSIYFSILLYYVVRDNQVNYLRFINQINYQFYNYISQVYTKRNFIEELQKNPDNYIYMKKLCSKLIDIKLIDNRILYDNIDLIYETEFSTIFGDNIKSNSIIKIPIHILSKDNTEFIYDLFTNDFINFKLKEFYIKAFQIYYVKKNLFFKQLINLTQIKTIIKSKEILNLLQIFEETYQIQLNDYVPSYLTYYIPIILYINSNLEQGLKLELNFAGGRKELFDCCIFYFRLHMISYIIYLIIEQIDKSTILNILNILIENLIEDSQDFRNYNDRIGDSIREIKRDGYKILFKRGTQDIYKIFYIEVPHQPTPFELFDNFNEKFDVLFDIEKFVFNNKTFITKEFLIYNIDRINEDQKKDLIEFYCRICYQSDLNESGSTALVEEIYYFEHLYILLFGCPPFERGNVYKYFFNMKSYSLDFAHFVAIIDKLKEDLDLNNFIKQITNEKDKIFKDEFTIIPGYNYDTTKIKDVEFQKKNIKDGIFSGNILVQKDIIQGMEFDVYQIIDNNYVRYNCISTHVPLYYLDAFRFKIIDIYVNGNKVLKFGEIIYPFKYLIPNTTNNLIYEENGVYNIIFNLNFFGPIDTILGKNSYPMNSIYRINPSNQFFLEKFTSNSNFQDWNLLCLNNQLNGYNILYINFDKTTTDTNSYSSSSKYASILNFNKSTIFEEEINYKIIDFKLLNPVSDGNNLLEFKIGDLKDKTESYKKLLFKISQCNINETNKQRWIQKFNLIIQKLENKIIRFTEFIKNITLGDLINNYSLLQSYLLNNKILNFIKKILANIDNQDNLCSITKNYNNLFNTKQTPHRYKFEILFELINGNEILKEQMERYQNMIQSYDNYEKNKRGGGVAQVSTSAYDYTPQNVDSLEFNDDLIQNETSVIDINMDLQYSEQPLRLCSSPNYYQLHHFMMGKGKSAIITPLLSLYFNIIKDKNIYIIVPKHLVNQTRSTLQDYLDIFQIKNIFIKSDDDIKKEFLEGKFIEIKKTIFIIDEIDSLINPLTSNFNNLKIENFIDHDKFKIDDIRTLIKSIINIDVLTREQLIDEIKKYPAISNQDLLADNILSIKEQLRNYEIKFNIDWGIDSDELFAIPFRSKDKPIKNSSFTSVIKTLYLSYYYYIIIKKYKIDDYIFNYIKYNFEIFNIFFKRPFEELSIEFINKTLEDNHEIKNIFFDLLFNEIFSKIKLPKDQYNTSFIDIINIDNIFKIGYSGTVNINLPNVNNTFKFHQECIYPDADESTNIEYAIVNSVIYTIDELSNITKFNALIDVCGFFYNSSNYKIAFELYEIFNTNIIFIDEKDEKMVIRENGKLEKLNENIVYENPFFYYDQGHIVGTDIKQDNYPVLHGLCIVDNLSYYSEVAQAMFRLRKLNLGHRISFFLNKFDKTNTGDLLRHFRQNEDNLKEQQKNNLNLQALKSDIRKNRKDPIFMERYKEDLYYYFREDLNKNPLDLIYKPSENPIDLKQYELDLEGIKKIIFDIEFNTSSIQHQQKTQMQTETQSNTQLKTQTQIRKLESINVNGYDLFKKYIFKDFDFIKKINTEEYFNQVTIQIDNIISFLPNIFWDNYTDFTSNLYVPNEKTWISFHSRNINKDLIFVYIHTVEKFILIPIFMVVYLYNDFLMLDINLNVINTLQRYYNPIKIKELEENKYVKIITNRYTNEEISTYVSEFKQQIENKRAWGSDNYQRYIFPFVISYYLLKSIGIDEQLKSSQIPENLLKYQIVKEAFNTIDYKGYMYESQHGDFFYNYLENGKIFDSLIRTYRQVSSESKRKYLKYKAKYLNLKKLFN
jgi:hypothetical protein